MAIIDQLVALINSANSRRAQLTAEQIVFSNPIPDVGPSWDTKVTVTAVPKSGYIGQVEVFYNRIQLSAMGSGLSLISESPFTIESIASVLSETRNAFLLDTDMQDFVISNMNVGDIRTVILKAKHDSLGWEGSLTITLLFGLPSNIGSLHTLMNNTLPNNNYLTS
jgi:hypothetical protein